MWYLYEDIARIKAPRVNKTLTKLGDVHRTVQKISKLNHQSNDMTLMRSVHGQSHYYYHYYMLELIHGQSTGIHRNISRIFKLHVSILISIGAGQ
jgi:hypothetical protein